MSEVKAEVKAEVKPTKIQKRGKPRNYDLGNGVYRFSRTRMFHKKALYKFIGKSTTPKTVKPKKPQIIMKEVSGEKNGKFRMVAIKKSPSNYPTMDPIKKHHAKKCFKDHKRNIRSSLKPGTICILLAGPHKGKRVVYLKSLKTGLLVVTGPFLINGCPMRRVSQNYVIATSTRIKLTEKISKDFNDDYFKRKREKRLKKAEGSIFTEKKEAYKPTDTRKEDQKKVDKIVIDSIKKHPEKKMLYTYLSAMFGLRSSQYPHRMKF